MDVCIYLQGEKCLFILVDIEKKNALNSSQESKLPSSTQNHLVRKIKTSKKYLTQSPAKV